MHLACAPGIGTTNPHSSIRMAARMSSFDAEFGWPVNRIDRSTFSSKNPPSVGANSTRSGVSDAVGRKRPLSSSTPHRYLRKPEDEPCVFVHVSEPCRDSTIAVRPCRGMATIRCVFAPPATEISVAGCAELLLGTRSIADTNAATVAKCRYWFRIDMFAAANAERRSRQRPLVDALFFTKLSSFGRVLVSRAICRQVCSST
jgi:hypothetical protein